MRPAPPRRVGENLPYSIETDYYFNNFAYYLDSSYLLFCVNFLYQKANKKEVFL